MRPRRPIAYPYHVPLKSNPHLNILFFHVLVNFTTLSVRRNIQTRLVKCKRFENYCGLAEVRINLEFIFRYRDLEKTSGKKQTPILWLEQVSSDTSSQRFTAALTWLVRHFYIHLKNLLRFHTFLGLPCLRFPQVKFLAVFNFFPILHMFSLRNKYINSSMEHSPSWKTDSSSASQGIPRILRNVNVHYRVHNSPPLPSWSTAIMSMPSYLGLGLTSGLFPSDFPNITIHIHFALRSGGKRGFTQFIVSEMQWRIRQITLSYFAIYYFKENIINTIFTIYKLYRPRPDVLIKKYAYWAIRVCSDARQPYLVSPPFLPTSYYCGRHTLFPLLNLLCCYFIKVFEKYFLPCPPSRRHNLLKSDNIV